jgi:hypothetical protein
MSLKSRCIWSIAHVPNSSPEPHVFSGAALTAALSRSISSAWISSMTGASLPPYRAANRSTMRRRMRAPGPLA